MSQILSYARVSTDDQDLAEHLESAASSPTSHPRRDAVRSLRVRNAPRNSPALDGVKLDV
jgi:hypothetical protein